MSMTRKKISATVALLVAAPTIATAEHGEKVLHLNELKVIGTTPLHGVGVDKNRLPYPVQTADSETIENAQSLDVSDYMARQLGSVHINQAQNNPLQPDLQYRGFTASPLLGNSQGLSVYMNGVRINEPFGDAVNWDVIPQSAIGGINLMAGSNPLFGLNTLGGALSIKTKNGFTNPGHSVQAYAGSFNRRAGEFESGGNDGNLSYFVTGNWFKEDGWRDHSESEAKQLFSSFGWKSGGTELELTLAAANTDLNGNGASPLELLKQDRNAVFTHPDNTENELRMAALSASHWLSDNTQFTGAVYFRKSDRETFNGDGSDYGVIDSFDGGGNGLNEDGDIIISAAECGGGCSAGDLIEDDGEQIEDQNGNAINPGLDDDEIAVNNRSTTEQDGFGLSGQLTFLDDLMGHENQLVAGFSFDQADIDYAFKTEIAAFTDNRGTVGSGLLDAESIVDASVKTSTASLFFMDNFSVNEKLTLTFAGRYNYSRIKISGTSGDDSVVPAGESGTHTFIRFNPSTGLTYVFRPQLTGYLSYSESSRVPTPAELTCHDQTNPCALPNSFLSDPPLDMVVAKTWEAGLRGVQQEVNWHVGLFQTVNHDDIYFLPTEEGPGLSPGFFDNIGKTRRRGLELSLAADYKKWNWFLNYSWIAAEFMDSFTVNAENNPAVPPSGDLRVSSGDTIPSIPRHTLKWGADWNVTAKLSLGFSAVYNSSQYFRGDEANVSSQVGGYTVFNLRGRYNLNKNVELFARVDNLFDREYETFGLYGESDEAPGFGGFSDSRFYGAGAPRGGWLGVKIKL